MESRNDGNLLSAADLLQWHLLTGTPLEESYLSSLRGGGGGGGEEISSLAHFLCTLGMFLCVSAGCGKTHCMAAGNSQLSSSIFPFLVIRK